MHSRSLLYTQELIVLATGSLSTTKNLRSLRRGPSFFDPPTPKKSEIRSGVSPTTE